MAVTRVVTATHLANLTQTRNLEIPSKTYESPGKIPLLNIFSEQCIFSEHLQ